jgi:hypothetical protein
MQNIASNFKTEEKESHREPMLFFGSRRGTGVMGTRRDKIVGVYSPPRPTLDGPYEVYNRRSSDTAITTTPHAP